MQTSSRLAVLSLIACLAAHSTASAQDAKTWLLGPALAEKLNDPIDIDWNENASLRDSLGRLASVCRVAMVLDRRIDPSRKLDIKQTNQPLRSVVQAIAERFNTLHASPSSFPRPAPPIQATLLGSVIYLGPQASARDLRTIAEVRRDEVRKLSAVQAERLNARVGMRWPERATPRQILAELAQRSGVEIAGIEEHVPHDLWPAGDWPAMSLVERLTLLLAQFDLTFRVEDSGKRVRLAKLTPDDAKIQRTHDVPRNTVQTAEQWRKACPDAEIKLAGTKVTVRGRLEDHEWLNSPAKSKTAGVAAKGRTVYTLTVTDEKLGAVIRGLAKQLNLKLTMDEEAIRAAGIDLDKRVTFTVTQAPLDELLKAALPKGLKYRYQNDMLEISPAK